MREGWTYKKFEDCLVKAPKAKQVQTSQYNTGTKYPIISQEDTLISGFFDDDAYLFHIDNPIVVFGDHTRVLKYIDFDFVVGADGVKILIPKEFLNAKLLYYYLLWYKIPNLGYSRHYKLLKEIDIPVPSLSEQQSIVAELDKINELISLKKAQLSDLDSLAQSIFYDMFGDPIENEKGWEVKKLDSIYKVTSSKRVLQEEWKTEGIPFYKVADIVSLINDEKVIPNTFITEAKYNELKLQSLVPNTGDILVTSRGTLGQCYIVKADDQFYFQDGMITWLSAKEVGISPIYIKMLFKTESFLNSLVQKANISTVAYLSINQLANRFIPLPPLSLQQEFAKRIELIEQQKAQISSTIKDLETLLASRMQYWFD